MVLLAYAIDRIQEAKFYHNAFAASLPVSLKGMAVIRNIGLDVETARALMARIRLPACRCNLRFPLRYLRFALLYEESFFSDFNGIQGIHI